METLIDGLNRKNRDFSIVSCQYYFSDNFWKVSIYLFWKKNTYSEKDRERVNLAIGREWKSSGLIPVHLLHHKYKNNQEECSWLFFPSRVLTPFIQESKNGQKDCAPELIKAVRIEKCGIYATRGIFKSFLLKLSRIDICCVMILLICVCGDYINCLYD